MALLDSAKAVGAVSEVLRAQLQTNTSATTVDVGRPEAAVGKAGPKLNLFLYQLELDATLRSRAFDTGQRPALWLVLRYLLTAVDGDKETDSVAAHELLGEAMLALTELNFLRPTVPALLDNPEPLKVTLDNGDVELLSKVMQGSDEHYRLSAAFQVRPVLIVPTETPTFAPLVRSVGPPDDEGVVVMPTLGHSLSHIDPVAFQAGDTIVLYGSELTSEIEEVCLGDVCYPITAAPAGTLRAAIPADTELSAGDHTVVARRRLPSGSSMSSNAVLGRLLPTLSSATPGSLTDDGSGNFHGTLTLGGTRLGGSDDSIFVAFYQAGVKLMLEASGVAAQNALSVAVSSDDALPGGLYRIILRVNGAQAPEAPEVNWS